MIRLRHPGLPERAVLSPEGTDRATWSSSPKYLAVVTPEQVLGLLLQQEALRTPQPWYDLLHEKLPVAPTPAGFHLVSRHADVTRVLRDNETFRSPGTEAIIDAIPQMRRHPGLGMVSRTLLALDGPEHRHLRKLSAREFTPRRIAALSQFAEDLCAKTVNGIRARIEDGEVVDLMSGLAVELPLELIAELVGIPGTDREHLATVVRKLLQLIEPGPTEPQLNEADAAYLELESYLTDLVHDRRKHPRSDFVSAIVGAADASTQPYSEDQLILSLMVIWAAGFDTSAAAIGNGIGMLFTDRRLMQRVPEYDDATMQEHIDELMRLECPMQIPPGFRFATQDVTIAGTAIPAGTEVRVLLSAANRDRTAFTNPDSFLLDRPGRTTLAFGAGAHYCLGAALARVEVATVLRQCSSELSYAQLTEVPRHRTSLLFRTYAELKVSRR